MACVSASSLASFPGARIHPSGRSGGRSPTIEPHDELRPVCLNRAQGTTLWVRRVLDVEVEGHDQPRVRLRRATSFGEAAAG